MDRENQRLIVKEFQNVQNIQDINMTKTSYIQLKELVQSQLDQLKIDYNDFNETILNDFCFYISQEHQDQDKKVVIEFLMVYLGMFVKKCDFVQLILYYYTNKKIMNQYFEIYKTFNQEYGKQFLGQQLELSYKNQDQEIEDQDLLILNTIFGALNIALISKEMKNRSK
ncbi:hypothetical protein PPERSA_10197 [Pseudocohnilembus persalinus]|uniref:Uncharacterized protein n=1 Tax=Pseudocohnilembus persalinus TaxID=266149 RepID=A0A0V0QLU8_PSEPJ|nr:hypothetical protein PPERSA_10197 [Pseudocohnilembus persalinus]|eukprot:KRX03116.1 hypothetical protein PPERSA_10197 [Pseudocohnilembus persalinus]